MTITILYYHGVVSATCSEHDVTGVTARARGSGDGLRVRTLAASLFVHAATRVQRFPVCPWALRRRRDNAVKTIKHIIIFENGGGPNERPRLGEERRSQSERRRSVATRVSSLLTRLDQQAGPGREPMTHRRRLVFRRERRHADGHRAAGRRPGRHRYLGGTVSGVQFLSVRVVVTVQPSDRADREQDQERQRQVNDGHPKHGRVGAAKIRDKSYG